MEVESSTYTDFISCDRAGRRNAVHDIEQDATTISMRKLSEDLGDLAVEGAESQGNATSSKNKPEARPKKQENSPSP
ncbi:cAMP-dependent protein kinase inhibitor gamma [Phaethornis superciliosus]